MHEAVDSGQRLAVPASRGRPGVECVDARLAVNKESAPRFRMQGSLRKCPRFGRRDVIHPVWWHPVGSRDERAVVIDYYERPPIPGKQLRRAIKPRAVRLHLATKGTARRFDLPVEGGADGRWGDYTGDRVHQPTLERQPSFRLHGGTVPQASWGMLLPFVFQGGASIVSVGERAGRCGLYLLTGGRLV